MGSVAHTKAGFPPTPQLRDAHIKLTVSGPRRPISVDGPFKSPLRLGTASEPWLMSAYFRVNYLPFDMGRRRETKQRHWRSKAGQNDRTRSAPANFSGPANRTPPFRSSSRPVLLRSAHARYRQAEAAITAHVRHERHAGPDRSPDLQRSMNRADVRGVSRSSGRGRYACVECASLARRLPGGMTPTRGRSGFHPGAGQLSGALLQRTPRTGQTPGLKNKLGSVLSRDSV